MTVGGLPLHPLIVHAVVVLIPLAALGTLFVAARPVWRHTYGIPVLALAVAGLLAVPIARASGTDLATTRRLQSEALDLHMARADTVLPATIVFVALLAAAVVLDRRAERAEVVNAGATTTMTRIVPVVAVLAAIAGIVATVTVVLTGDAGATAVWGTG